MSNARNQLIDDLVADLRPVRRAGRVGRPLAVWIVLAFGYTAAALAFTAPYREDAWRSLAAFPAFAVETLVALVAVLTLARAALLSGVPGAGGSLRSVSGPAVLVLAWIAFYVVGFGWPAHPVSEAGHRDHCLIETLLIALPNLALMLWYVRRLAPPWPRLSGVLAGAAAAAVPGALMQFACMYMPAHILGYHLVPIGLMAAAGALLAPVLLLRRPDSPRRHRNALH